MRLKSLPYKIADQKMHIRRGAYGVIFLMMLALAALCSQMAYAGVTASISGTVTDASGGAIAGATVIATNLDTGIRTTQSTNGQGYYSFQSLPPGRYTVEVQQPGFKSYVQTGLVLDVDAALVVDASLPVGQGSEKIEVKSDALHIGGQQLLR